MSNYYTVEELNSIGFKAVGKKVLISRKASIYGEENISIGNNVRIDDFAMLSGRVEIGNHIHISAYTALFGGKAGICMLDFSGLSSKVMIYATSDDYSGNALTNPVIPDTYRKVYEKKVVINKHVIVGASTVILPGVEIGEGAAVGSMSLVNKNVEPWTIYAGIPAKHRAERKKDLLSLESEFLSEWK